MRAVRAIWAGAVLVLTGCSTLQAQAPAASVQASGAGGCNIASAELWGRTQLASELRIDGDRVGGLSGIDYRKDHGDYLAVSDDRGDNGGSKAYRVVLELRPDHSIEARVTDAIILPRVRAKGGGLSETKSGSDTESVRQATDGWLYWTSEGEFGDGQGPGLFRRRWPDGQSHRVKLPRHLVLNALRRTGPRDNRSFEGLGINSETGEIWLGLEAPLLEDGAIPTILAGAWTRIVPLAAKGHKKNVDFFYPLAPIARQLPGKLADNGLSELIALPGPAFLVLERSGSQQPDGTFRFSSSLYCAAPNGASTALDKQLIASFDNLGDFDTANFEGMTFGPLLPDGRRSLVLVADNNFAANQPTIIAVLALSNERP